MQNELLYWNDMWIQNKPIGTWHKGFLINKTIYTGIFKEIGKETEQTYNIRLNLLITESQFTQYSTVV